MPAERAGRTVTMFVIDVSKSMGDTRTIQLDPGPNGEPRSREVTKLQWALQFVLLKVQELIFTKRKTDLCGVVLVGTDETDNRVNEMVGDDSYQNVTEYIHIAQPTPDTLAKINAIRPSQTTGDALDGLIVALQAQETHLQGKKTWTRKIVLVTDGETELQQDGRDDTIQKMNECEIVTSIVGVDFDDEELPFIEEGKSETKRENEQFWHDFAKDLANDAGLVGTLEYALQECARPDVKTTKSALLSNTLRFGDFDDEDRRGQAIQIAVRTSKATAITRPPTMKRFIKKEKELDAMEWENGEGPAPRIHYGALDRRTDYFLEDPNANSLVKQEEGDDTALVQQQPSLNAEARVDPEDLVRAYKYGSTYVPFEEGMFEKLDTKKGLDICGFMPLSRFHREWAMGEVYYIWGDPNSTREQIALSSFVQAMAEKEMAAVVRLTTGDGRDSKMGIAVPRCLEEVDCLLWVQMPFAEDYRKYTFKSLENLFNKKGERVIQHPSLPTDNMIEAMDDFVDSMDLMQAGEKGEDGERYPWFDTIYSYNPAVHRVKQALFHAAVVDNIAENPLPPAHPELLKFLNPPKRVTKKAKEPLNTCKDAFNISQVTAKITARKKDNALVEYDENAPLLLENAPIAPRGLLPPLGPQITQGEDVSANDVLRKSRQTTPDGPPVSRMSQTRIRSASPNANVDRGIEPGRIIGSTFPLEDFKNALAQGDIVSKAVEDLGAVLQELVVKPFASRRKAEYLECLKFLRETCLKEDEIDSWNEFIREFKDLCKGEEGNPSFWEAVKALGKEITLISKTEAQRAGGKSRVADATALKFIQD